MIIDTDKLNAGFYAISPDKQFYEISLPIKTMLSKKINMVTGEVTYPTNYDKVRDMSVEELAQFIEDAACPPGEAPDKFLDCTAENCPKCWLAWLRKEVDK